MLIPLAIYARARRKPMAAYRRVYDYRISFCEMTATTEIDQLWNPALVSSVVYQLYAHDTRTRSRSKKR